VQPSLSNLRGTFAREEASWMMEGGMGSMMGWMMPLGWLAGLVLVALVVVGAVWLVRMLSDPNRTAQPATTGANVAKIALVVLAVIGAVALVSATAMAVMHAGMGCCGTG
jgi:hypothetical protein